MYEGRLMGTVNTREADAETLGLMMAGSTLDAALAEAQA